MRAYEAQIRFGSAECQTSRGVTVKVCDVLVLYVVPC